MKINQETKKNILTITYAGVVLFVILYFSKVIGFLASIWQLLVPFIIGFAIAFVLNIIIPVSYTHLTLPTICSV